MEVEVCLDQGMVYKIIKKDLVCIIKMWDWTYVIFN